MRNRLFIPGIIAIILIYIVYADGRLLRSPTGDSSAFSGNTMGTTYSVRVTGCDASSCGPLNEAIQRRLKELEGRLSHYDPKSEVSLFNTHTNVDWFPVSEDLYEIVNYALTLSTSSKGAFDITVAPAVNAWGFGPDEGQQPPNEGLAKAAGKLIGYQQLSTRVRPRAIRKSNPAVNINLSALAKGYAVDQLALLIEREGHKNYLVEIGGEIRAAGLRADNRPWRIGIQPPQKGLAIDFIITPGNEAVATSGDYQNFYFVDEKRVSHTIDPDSGKPVMNNLASVSVIAPSAMQADALATLMMVIGPEASLSMAQEQDLPLLIFIREQDNITAINSTAFEPYIISIE